MAKVKREDGAYYVGMTIVPWRRSTSPFALRRIPHLRVTRDPSRAIDLTEKDARSVARELSTYRGERGGWQVIP